MLMKKYAVLVAGGEGTRIGGGLPKQFREVCNKPLLWWSMKAFHDEDPDTRIILVLHPGFFELWDEIFLKLPEEQRFAHEVVGGGKSRTESVKNGLRDIPASADVLVAVHDAARPLAGAEMIARGWKAAAEAGGAVPAVLVTDSLRKLADDGSTAVDRRDFVAVQTPQVFRADLLKEAYLKNPDAVFSDDASAFEAAGFSPVLYEGNPQNMKVTNPGDIEIASLLLQRRNEACLL